MLSLITKLHQKTHEVKLSKKKIALLLQTYFDFLTFSIHNYVTSFLGLLCQY